VADKFILLWVYGDDDDTPYLIKNPQANLSALLTEWTALDRAYMRGEPGAEEVWEPVNDWLKAKGVEIIDAEEIRLDDYQVTEES
jgi:hypothetical protein